MIKTDINNWIANDGDNTHALDYPLTNESIVVDLGGFKGVWVDMLLAKHKGVQPNIIIVEPITEFYNILKNKFQHNDKITLLNVGVSVDGEDKEKTIYINGERTSTNFKDGIKIVTKFQSLKSILDSCGVNFVDLLQINIEGDEYPLLEHVISNGVINKFKNIQIQYHLGIKDDVERRDNIQKSLTDQGFIKKFDYPFVWESWYKDN